MFQPHLTGATGVSPSQATKRTAPGAHQCQPVPAPALGTRHEAGCAWDESTCTGAASYGHLACLRYAHEEGCAWDDSTCANAAEHGHLACLQYACEHGCPSRLGRGEACPH